MSTTTDNCMFLDVGALSHTKLRELADISDKNQRRQEILKLCSPFSKKNGDSNFTTKETRSIQPMSLFGHLSSILCFAFGVPGAVVTVPAVTIIIGLFASWKVAGIAAAALLIPLSIFPVHFIETSLTSWMAVQILKYFSFKVIFEEQIKANRPTILVAPPHGVFPFGNIVTMIGFPSVMGFSFRGLAASSALRTPIFRQLLGTIGVIDASASSAGAALANNRTIGISTGGVAEVFETNNKDQVIVLQSRKGIIKLAFKHGADLVPCYLFGNTELLSLWTGGSMHEFFKNLSRKIGFATIIFWGRFGLPVPYRIPIMGVMAKPIQVPKKDNPTDEEIDTLHKELLKSMVDMFDKYKHSYGWGDKKLVII